VDDDGNVLEPGTRVQSVILDDGTVIVENGDIPQNAPAISVATVDFLARGGDQYPFRDVPFTVLGVSYQQALSNYIQALKADDGLEGMITEAQYPEGGEGRIIEAP
jgi:5'-nucleotidase